MKKTTKKIFFLTAAAAAGIYAYNKFVETSSTKKNLLSTENGTFYDWKFGKIFYTKKGNGKPVLLVHDTSASSSGFEWSKIEKKLEKEHTVYNIELLGCGRSDKPGLQYTNYMYVQLLTSFVRDVIQETTDVIASNLSTSFTIMASQIEKELFDKVILINPTSPKKLQLIPDGQTKIKSMLFYFPLIGTFLYNVIHCPLNIDNLFRTKYFAREELISSKTEDIYYESAHLNASNGKYLFSSLIGNYMNLDIVHALKKIDKPVYLIGSNGQSCLDEYHKLNSNFETTTVSGGKMYPHMEVPEKVYAIISSYLN